MNIITKLKLQGFTESLKEVGKNYKPQVIAIFLFGFAVGVIFCTTSL